jgi:hypothetical protein
MYIIASFIGKTWYPNGDGFEAQRVPECLAVSEPEGGCSDEGYVHNTYGKHARFGLDAGGPRYVLLTCLYSTAAFGVCTLGGTVSRWTSGNGDWNSSNNWSSGVPNSSTNACITDGTSAVSLATNGSVDSLQIASGNALNLNFGGHFSVFGTQIINDGQIALNGGNGSNTSLILDNNVTLSERGTLTLSVAGGGGNTFIEQSASAARLTNKGTIQGAGTIGNGGLALTNLGTVNANSSGQTLLLNGSGGIINTNLFGSDEQRVTADRVCHS